MRAALFAGSGPTLQLVARPCSELEDHFMRIRVLACGVCRTDLHIVDGELRPPRLPIIPGHQIVGIVEELGPKAMHFQLGDCVGVPWLAQTCGRCLYCRTDRENLCDEARFTGFHIDGGFAEYAACDSRFAVPMPSSARPDDAAPLLCAGIIGHRALRMVGGAERLGLYGFGSAAHILAQVARHQGRSVFAFTRPGDLRGQDFARSLGAVWAGDSDTAPPSPLDAAILFAPVGALVPRALAAVVKGGTVVCAGIHMSDIPSFPYSLLWQERSLRSVANLTRQDAREFFEGTTDLALETHVRCYALDDVNSALNDLREGKIEGSAVVIPGESQGTLLA